MQLARNPAEMKGLTLVEFLISLAIVSILVAIVVPSLSEFINENRLTSTMSQLVNDLNLARAEAVKRNSRVLVCARASTTSTCASVTDWGNGWLVCYDGNSDDVCDAGTADDPNPIRVVSPLHATLTLTSTTALVRFNPVGTSNGAATFTLTGTWSGATTRTGTVAGTGNISSKKN